MTVYVDDALIPAQVGRIWSHWSHMTADTQEELHHFAQKIGMQRRWFQDKPNGFWHYDLTSSKREVALAHGAKPIETMDMRVFKHIWHGRGREGVHVVSKQAKKVKLGVAQRICQCTGHVNQFVQDQRSRLWVHSACGLPRLQYYLAARSSMPPGVPIKYAKGLKDQ